MATYLDAIVAFHRARAAQDRRAESELAASVVGAPPVRDFTAALRGDGIAVIAEVKRRSPSAGDLAPNLNAALLARAYAEGGAACLSVLTDEPHFGGSAEDLANARAAAGLPVLRKDFTVSRADCYDTRAMGADALLLIVAALDRTELAELHALARALGLATLVEVHDEGELATALDIGATLVGVNQRDLRSFTVDQERAIALAGAMPEGITRVAESGIRTPGDVARLGDAGYDAILVGEALVTAVDPAAALRELIGQHAGRSLGAIQCS